MNRIKELRTAKGVTLDEMQEQTGINRVTISQYERGKREPKLATWQKLAKYFDVSVPYLQGISNVRNKDGFSSFESFASELGNYNPKDGSITIDPSHVSLDDEILLFLKESSKVAITEFAKLFIKRNSSKSISHISEKNILNMVNQIDDDSSLMTYTNMERLFIVSLLSFSDVHDEDAIEAFKQITYILDKFMEKNAK